MRLLPGSIRPRFDALDQRRRWPALSLRGFLAIFVLLPLVAGCNRRASTAQTPTSEQLAQASLAYSLGRSGVTAVKVYFDASTSMRGFALGATANEAGAGDEFQSILTAVDSASSVLQPSGPNGAAAVTNASRFGGAVEALPNKSILQAALGRTDLAPMAGQTEDSRSASKDCAGSSWNGSAAVRRRIDALYSERITCLNVVFDEVLSSENGNEAAIVVTDAEQEAPIGSTSCPSARNLGTIQANLNEWVRRGRYVAVVAFRLRSLGWNSTLEPRQYCSCGVRQLYVYLMTPSAEQAETIYAHLARHWKGKPESIAYLPFTPRPASQYDVSMAIVRSANDPPASVPSTAPTYLTNPEQGALPQFWIKLNAEEAELRFDVTAAAFEDPTHREGPGFFNVDWSKVAFEWQHPTHLVLATSPESRPPADAAKGGTETPPQTAAAAGPVPRRYIIESSSNSLALEFTQLPPLTADSTAAAPSKPQLPPITRTGHFNARQKLLAPEALTKSLATVRYQLRKLPGHPAGTELFVMQLDTTSVDLPDQIAAAMPFVRSAERPCLTLDNLTSQMRFVYRRSPVARFLLRVDY